MNLTTHSGLVLGFLLLSACSGDGGADGGGGTGAGTGGTGDGGSGNTTSTGTSTLDCTGAPVDGPARADSVVPIAGVTVSTIAGSATQGSADGLGSAAQFHNPVNLVVSPPDTLWIADFDNGAIRRSTFGGDVSTHTQQANFARPFGLVLAADGSLLVQTDYDETGKEAGNSRGAVWKIDGSTGEATSLATAIGRPRGMARLTGGKIAISDPYRHDLRLLDATTGQVTALAGVDGCPDFDDGRGGAARFNAPYGLVATSNGDVLVADHYNHVIRRVTQTGDVSTFAGDGVPGMVDGPLAEARFDHPQDLAIDAAGNVYVADRGNLRIRVIGTDGQVRTAAGDGVAGFTDGAGASARFFGLEGIDVTPDGKTLFVADGTGGEPGLPYHRIRKVSLP